MVDLKSPDEIAKMRESGRIAYLIMEEMAAFVRPGVTTRQIDAVARKNIEKFGVAANFLGYRGYPAAICASVNDEIVHGIPGGRVLDEGDIVGIDFGVVVHGYHSDMARTVPVGSIGAEAQHAIDTAKQCFFAGLAKYNVGGRLHDICGAIEDCARKNGATVPRELIGHGIGRSLHEDPDVPNYRPMGQGIRLKPGLVICIEPMICLGAAKVSWDSNGWTARTADGGLSAHYENTCALTADGPVLMTAP